MQRDDWAFEYAALRLAEAAAAKREHHQQRLSWWKERKDDVIAEVHQITTEARANSLMSDEDSLGAPPMLARNDLQRRLTECRDKLEEHDAKVREFDIWYRVLMENPETRLKLHHDDWLYFLDNDHDRARQKHAAVPHRQKDRGTHQ
ncbi:conserved hypothetical protein [Gammaproteobacteria bacterium]